MWCDQFRGSDKTEVGSQMLSLYRSISVVRAGTRTLIKHGEITALEDSIAAPQKLNHQPLAKNQN